MAPWSGDLGRRDDPAVILAIDPGMSGALAFVSDDGHLVEVIDMPTVEVRGKRRVSASLVREVMMKRPIDRVIIEGVSAMPRRGANGSEFKMGASSSISFGYGAGLLEGVATGLGIPVEIVLPAVWKRRASVPADKGAARQMAQRCWPGAAARFARVKDDGRADSSLLGRWAALQ